MVLIFTVLPPSMWKRLYISEPHLALSFPSLPLNFLQVSLYTENKAPARHSNCQHLQCWIENNLLKLHFQLGKCPALGFSVPTETSLAALESPKALSSLFLAWRLCFFPPRHRQYYTQSCFCPLYTCWIFFQHLQCSLKHVYFKVPLNSMGLTHK